MVLIFFPTGMSLCKMMQWLIDRDLFYDAWPVYDIDTQRCFVEIKKS